MRPESDVPAPTPGGPVTRVPTGSRVRFVVLLILVLVVSVGATTASYVSVEARLPPSMAVHYDASGRANGFASPAMFLEVGVGTEIAIGLAMAGLVWAITGIPWFTGPRRSLTLWGVVMALAAPGVSVAVIWSVSFREASGAWPAALPGATALGLLTLFALTLAGLGLAWGTSRGTVPSSNDGRTPTGRGLRFQCAACGGISPASSWSLLGPRVGGFAPGARGAAYYRRCPLCGERGWQRLIR